MDTHELKAISQELRVDIIRMLVEAGSGHGGGIENSLKAAETLKQKGIEAEVVNIQTIKPSDRELIADRARSHKKIVTVKDHGITGGLGTGSSQTDWRRGFCRIR